MPIRKVLFSVTLSNKRGGFCCFLLNFATGRLSCFFSHTVDFWFIGVYAKVGVASSSLVFRSNKMIVLVAIIFV